jgi:hypothetical protein
MTKFTSLIGACLIVGSSFSTLAAERIEQQTPDLVYVGMVSAFGAGSPNELYETLAEKADKLGGSKFKVVLTDSNDNSERGTAIVYQ